MSSEHDQEGKAIEREVNRILDRSISALRMITELALVSLLNSPAGFPLPIALTDSLFAKSGWEHTDSSDGVRTYKPVSETNLDVTRSITQRACGKRFHSYALMSLVPGASFVGQEITLPTLGEHQTYILLRPQGYEDKDETVAIGITVDNFLTDEGTASQVDFIPSLPTTKFNYQ